MKIVQKILLLLVFIVVVLVFLEIIPTAPKYKGTNPWVVGKSSTTDYPHGGAKELYPRIRFMRLTNSPVQDMMCLN